MNDRQLLNSIGLKFEKIAVHLGLSIKTVYDWSYQNHIPDAHRQAVLDLKEAVRQVVGEK